MMRQMRRHTEQRVGAGLEVRVGERTRTCNDPYVVSTLTY